MGYVIETLEKSDKQHDIYYDPRGGASSNPKDREKQKNREPTGSYINYNPSDMRVGESGQRYSNFPLDLGFPRVNLAHELWHSFETDQGRLDNTTTVQIPGLIGNAQIRVSEINAVRFENRVRSAAGLNQRTTYGLPIPAEQLRPRRELNNADFNKLIKCKNQDVFLQNIVSGEW